MVRFVLHGHFYQPPRENPWTESVPVEPSAAPFHDWNERILAECYRPNAHARVVDDHGRVVAIVSTYDHLSFNLGPTLAAWMDAHHPDVLAEIVASDGRTGRAIAQGYNHLIMPLAPERDVRTQVRWGLADFAHRFGRPSKGIWLPETAVNDDVLAVLAEEGVGFTILAPNQALAVRPLGVSEGAWHDVGDGSIDTRRPYRWTHPTQRGLGVDLIFYDGGLSHDLAFGLAGQSSRALVERVVALGSPDLLVAAAADGETFGHHHKFTERSIAYALAVEAPRLGVQVTSPAELLAEHPPTHEVRVRESAWSCAHGVGRWARDCGCSTGGEPGWTQTWRAPLRAALDVVRDHAAEVFETTGAEVLVSPWVARDAYIDVVLGRRSVEDFAGEHVRGDRVRALTLLEAQRHALLMYTSCGWFFNDLAGLETVQVLRYAGRCLDLLAEAGAPVPTDAFLAALGRAVSNDPAEGSGVDIWERRVLAVRVDDRRVAAHVALMDLLEGRPPEAVVAGYAVTLSGHRHLDRGSWAFGCGRVDLVHGRTGRTTGHLYAAVRLGGVEVVGVLRPVGAEPAADRARLQELVEVFERGAPLTELLRRLTDTLGYDEFGLEAALPDAADQVLEGSAQRLVDEVTRTSERLLHLNRDTFDALTAAGYPLPPALRVPAEAVFARRLEADLTTLRWEWSELAARGAAETIDEARRAGLHIDAAEVVGEFEAALAAATRRVVHEGASAGPVELLVRLARRVGAGIDVSAAQELVYATLGERRTAEGPPDPELRAAGLALGLAVDDLFRVGP